MRTAHVRMQAIHWAREDHPEGAPWAKGRWARAVHGFRAQTGSSEMRGSDLFGSHPGSRWSWCGVGCPPPHNSRRQTSTTWVFAQATARSGLACCVVDQRLPERSLVASSLTRVRQLGDRSKPTDWVPLTRPAFPATGEIDLTPGDVIRLECASPPRVCPRGREYGHVCTRQVYPALARA